MNIKIQFSYLTTTSLFWWACMDKMWNLGISFPGNCDYFFAFWMKIFAILRKYISFGYICLDISVFFLQKSLKICLKNHIFDTICDHIPGKFWSQFAHLVWSPPWFHLTFLFLYRLHNKGVYFRLGMRKLGRRTTCKELNKELRLEVDGVNIELPSIEGILVLNISR